MNSQNTIPCPECRADVDPLSQSKIIADYIGNVLLAKCVCRECNIQFEPELTKRELMSLQDGGAEVIVNPNLGMKGAITEDDARRFATDIRQLSVDGIFRRLNEDPTAFRFWGWGDQ